MADDRAVVLPLVRVVGRPVLVEALVHERALVVVGEVVDDRVRRVLEEVGVLVAAGREPGVDQEGGRVVADRVPVLPRLVHAERLAARVERDRVDVREEALAVAVEEEAVEELVRQLDVVLDPRIAGDAEGLRRAGKRVDLLVGRDRVVVVAELGGEDLLLLAACRVDAVHPVGDALGRVDRAHMVAQVLRALLGDLEEAVLAGHQVGRRKAVDEPRDRVRLLPRARQLVALERDLRAVDGEVDVPVGPLGVAVEVRDLAHLLHPPLGPLEHEILRLAADEDDALRLEHGRAALGVEDAVGEEDASAVEHLAHLAGRVDVGLAQVAGDLGVGLVRDRDVELAAVDRLQREGVLVCLVRDDRPRDRVGEGEVHSRVHRCQGSFLGVRCLATPGSRCCGPRPCTDLPRTASAGRGSAMSSGDDFAVSANTSHRRPSSSGTAKS